MNNRGRGSTSAGYHGSRVARLSYAYAQRQGRPPNRSQRAQQDLVPFDWQFQQTTMPDAPGSDEGQHQEEPSGEGLHRRSRKLPSDLVLQITTAPIDGKDDADADGRWAGGTIAPRPTYTEVQLEKTYQTRMEKEEQKAHVQSIKDKRKVGKEVLDKRTIARRFALKHFPFINTLRNYKIKEYGHLDLVSGISVGLFLIPQSIAYSLLANVRPQYGFYSAFFGMIVYFFIGSSRHLNFTNQGAVSLLVGEAVRAGMDQVYPNGAGLCASVATNSTGLNASLPLTTSSTAMNYTVDAPCISKDDANARIALTITMLAGVLQLCLGLLQLGFITNYLPDPLNAAFACAAALHICVGQLGNLLGAPIPAISGNGKFFLYIIEAFKAIIASKVNVPTILVASFSFLIMLGVKIFNDRCIKRIRVPIPIDTIVLIATLLLSKFLYWSDTLKIATVGDIRKGFEAPHAPLPEHFSTGSGIIVNGIVLGIISYAMSISLAKTFALRNGYEVDANQELIAYGVGNFGTCWFGTFVGAAAIACTSMQESMKGETQVYSLYATVVTLLAILVYAPEFGPVPKGVLAAIIVVNMKNMVLQVEQLPRLWRTNKYDFAIFLVTLLANICLDLPIGLGIGVVFSLATVIFRTQAPKAYLLGRLPRTDIYRNLKKHKKAEEIPGLKIFKFDGSLYYASAENYRTRLFRHVAMNPKKILAQAKARAKSEGRPFGEIDLRTDMLRSDGIKQILDLVRNEGEHPAAEARMEAQLNMPVDSVAQHQPENEEITSTVNTFCIILDFSACAFTDAVGIRLLSQIVDDYNKIGVEIYLSGTTSLVRSQLGKTSFYSKRSEEGLFVTVHDAVIYALSALHMELLEDEALRRREELAAYDVPTSEDATTSVMETDPGEPEPEHKLTPAELARLRRRNIRRESWRRDSAESSISAETLENLNAIHQVRSLPVLTEPDRGAGSTAQGDVGIRYAPPQETAQAVSNGSTSGGLYNPGFESETKF